MTYTTIRIPKEAHQLMKELAQKNKIAQQDLIMKALKILEEQYFWDECKKAYQIISENPGDLTNEINETKLFENSLMDGLDDEY